MGSGGGGLYVYIARASESRFSACPSEPSREARAVLIVHSPCQKAASGDKLSSIATVDIVIRGRV